MTPAARTGGTPLVVAEATPTHTTALGVIALTDVLKPGIRERLARLRSMGLRPLQAPPQPAARSAFRPATILNQVLRS